MRKSTIVIVGALCILCCTARDAFAWGPGVHIGLAESVWSQLGVLPAAVAAILARHRIPFLYGSVAADVVFAKRLSRVKQFCHHWSTAFGVLEAAETDRQKAFAYGYLSHLAADTVAHGKFVPRQIIVSNSPVNTGHLYWELRADAACDRATHQLVAEVLKADHKDHHAMLAGHLDGTLLPYDLNRMLFNRINAMTVRPAFRFSMDMMHRFARYELCDVMLAGYHNECIDRIQSILAEGHRSAVTKDDPNGTSALMRVAVERREAKRRRGGRQSTSHRVAEATKAFAPTLVLPAGEIATSEAATPTNVSMADAECLHV